MFYDEERGAGVPERSAEFYLALILGMLLLSGLLGFVLGSAVFIVAFLRRFGEVKYWQAALGAMGFILLLGILSNQLTLRYPTGLLQTHAGIELPWPLQ
jgi:hypothetical protein